MATVYRRGKTWTAQWYRPDGSRAAKSTGTDKKREAERIAAEFESSDRKAHLTPQATGTKYTEILRRAAAEAEAGNLNTRRAEEFMHEIRKVADPNFKAMSVSDHITEWTADQQKRVSESTAGIYRNMRDSVKKALAEKANLPIQGLTHDHAIKLLQALSKGRAAATANLMFRCFRRAMQQAVRAKHIMDNPAVGVPPLPEDNSTERVPFTRDEVAALIAGAASDEWKGCILIAAHTGLRIGDIVTLTPAHVHDGHFVLKPAKTKRNKKTVSIPISSAVARWIDGREKLFPSLSVAKKGTLSTWFDRIRHNCGVTKKGANGGSRSFHSLRHSFTSWLAEADVHADVRQKLTGHQSAGIHAGYTHRDKSLKRAIDKLPELIPYQPSKD